jgi:hypothetical protein
MTLRTIKVIANAAVFGVAATASAQSSAESDGTVQTYSFIIGILVLGSFVGLLFLAKWDRKRRPQLTQVAKPTSAQEPIKQIAGSHKKFPEAIKLPFVLREPQTGAGIREDQCANCGRIMDDHSWLYMVRCKICKYSFCGPCSGSMKQQNYTGLTLVKPDDINCPVCNAPREASKHGD